MKIKEVAAQLNENEREMYFHLSASEYLNRIYYINKTIHLYRGNYK